MFNFKTNKLENKLHHAANIASPNDLSCLNSCFYTNINNA